MPFVKFVNHWNSALLGNAPGLIYLKLISLKKYNLQFVMTLRHHLQLVNPVKYLLPPLTLLHLGILFIMGVTPLAVISSLDNDSCQKIWVGSWGNFSLPLTTAKNYTQNVWPLHPQLSPHLQSRNLKFSELCP